MDLTAEQLECAKIAASVLCRDTKRFEDFDDFHQVARIAVMEHVGRFDGSKGASERTWLTNKAKWAIKDYIRIEEGRWDSSIRRRQVSVSPLVDEFGGASELDGVDPRWEDLYAEVDEADERARALEWAFDVLAEELSEKFLIGVRAWLDCGKLKAAGELIGKTEGWICRCVKEAERVLQERSVELNRVGD
jgi:RNA polymerase sigma factor (sigma-70 family)